VNLVSQNGDIQVSKLAKSLKKQLSYIKIEGENSSNSPNNSVSDEKQTVEDVFHEPIVTTTSEINANGVLIRRSKKRNV
jgi:hypothetical protein